VAHPLHVIASLKAPTNISPQAPWAIALANDLVQLVNLFASSTIGLAVADSLDFNRGRRSGSSGYSIEKPF
jgi:hypothetical protein